MPSSGLATQNQLQAILIRQAIPILITGIFGFFKPCKTAVVIWCNPKKQTAAAIACVAPAAAGAL